MRKKCDRRCPSQLNWSFEGRSQHFSMKGSLSFFLCLFFARSFSPFHFKSSCDTRLNVRFLHVFAFTACVRVNLLHVFAFSKNVLWLAQTNVITLKTLHHAVNARWKREWQRAFKVWEHLEIWRSLSKNKGWENEAKNPSLWKGVFCRSV